MSLNYRITRFRNMFFGGFLRILFQNRHLILSQNQIVNPAYRRCRREALHFIKFQTIIFLKKFHSENIFNISEHSMIFSYLILSLLMARHSLKKHIPKYVAAEAIMIEKRKIITAILKSSSIAVDIK